MNGSNTSGQPVPIAGILSMILSPMGLLLVLYFASGAGRVTHPRAAITFAQYLLPALLASGLVSGIAGVTKREDPAWLSRAGLILTIFITGLIALFFYSLDD